MLHQWEEHDDDHFCIYVNGTVAKGRVCLTHLDVFIINIDAVWALFAASLWLTESAGPGWALIPVWLTLVTAAVHILPAVIKRRSNPGLWSAPVLFVPFGVWSLARLCPLTSSTQEAATLALALGIHLAIVAQAMRHR